MPSVVEFIKQLRADFDAHNHDGFNSKSFDSLIVRSLIASGLLSGSSIYIPDIINPKFSVDPTGRVRVSSLERNDFHWFTMFEGISTSYGTQGTIAINQSSVSIATSASANTEAELQKVATLFSSEFSWARDRKFRTVIKFTDTANQTCYIVTGAGQIIANTTRHFGFKVVDSTIYGSCADGTTQALTASLGTFSAGNTRSLEARFTAGSRVDFYINGVLSGSLTTNLPTGTLTANFLMDIWIRNQAAAVKTIESSYWDFWQASP